MSVASMPASVTLHLLLLAMHVIISSYSTPQRLRIILTLPSLFYSVSCQEGQPQISKICICSVKYQLCSTLGYGDFFFVTHKEFICHIFREWGKIPGTSIYYKDFWLIFFKALCFVGGLPVVFLSN